MVLNGTALVYQIGTKDETKHSKVEAHPTLQYSLNNCSFIIWDAGCSTFFTYSLQQGWKYYANIDATVNPAIFNSLINSLQSS